MDEKMLTVCRRAYASKAVASVPGTVLFHTAVGGESRGGGRRNPSLQPELEPCSSCRWRVVVSMPASFVF